MVRKVHCNKCGDTPLHYEIRLGLESSHKSSLICIIYLRVVKASDHFQKGLTQGM